MYLGVARLDLHIPAAHSLKQKRRVVAQLRARASSRGGMSFAEVGDNDLWQRAAVGVSRVYKDASAEVEFRGALEKLAVGEDYLVTNSVVRFERFP